jgi:hypothetical protein
MFDMIRDIFDAIEDFFGFDPIAGFLSFIMVADGLLAVTLMAFLGPEVAVNEETYKFFLGLMIFITVIGAFIFHFNRWPDEEVES